MFAVDHQRLTKRLQGLPEAEEGGFGRVGALECPLTTEEVRDLLATRLTNLRAERRIVLANTARTVFEAMRANVLSRASRLQSLGAERWDLRDSDWGVFRHTHHARLTVQRMVSTRRAHDPTTAPSAVQMNCATGK